MSSSEDRTVKIWRDGQCVQTITHPAISIWTVAACEETGDIVSGASDNIIRIFSRDPDRQADPEVRIAVPTEIGDASMRHDAHVQGLYDDRLGLSIVFVMDRWLMHMYRLLHPSKRAIACMPFLRRRLYRASHSRRRTCLVQVRER